MTDKLKTLKEMEKYILIEKPHPIKDSTGFQIIYKFPNGFGASIIRVKIFEEEYGSYTSNENEVELAVIIFNKNNSFELTYDTPITQDVIGHLLEKELVEVLNNIFNLTEENLK